MGSLELDIKQTVSVEKIVEIAEAAGEVILQIYGDDTDWEVTCKADDSPLTRADKEANNIICTKLLQLTPHIPIVSEENEEMPYEVRKEYQYFWCVDPLDGTKEFIKRNGQFTVNIALVRDQTPVLGVVHTPVAKTTHFASVGTGAYLKTDKSVERISVAAFSESDSALTIVGSRSHGSQLTEDFVKQFKDPKFAALGSSLKLIMVAEGKAHIYPRLAPTSEWDTAAAHVIVTEAGGEVLQAGLCDPKGHPLEDWKSVLDEQKPVVYNKEKFLNPYFVVYGGRKK
eukprot:g6881.t1